MTKWLSNINPHQMQKRRYNTVNLIKNLLFTKELLWDYKTEQHVSGLVWMGAPSWMTSNFTFGPQLYDLYRLDSQIIFKKSQILR